MSNPICPYCSDTSELVTGVTIYPHRPDLARKWFYLCADCNAYVGCHPKTKKPLGRLADSMLRGWKRNVHSLFDPLWESRKMSRKAAYAYLAEHLGIHRNECHIGMFDLETCKRAVNILDNRGQKD